MTTLDLYDELVDGIDEEAEPSEPVRDLPHAIRLMWALRRARRNAAEVHEAADAELDRVRRITERHKAEADQRVANLEQRLRYWHAAILRLDPTRKTLPIPGAGTLRASKAQQITEVTDRAAAVAFGQAHLPAIVRQPPPPAPEIGKTAVKEAVEAGRLKADSDGRLWLDGELLPGVRLGWADDVVDGHRIKIDDAPPE